MTPAETLRAEAAKRILVKDGAYGTSVQDRKLAADAYCGTLDLARDQRRFRNADAFPGPACDQQHTVVPRCENTDRVGELLTLRSPFAQPSHRYAFAHVSGGETDLKPEVW